MGWLIGALSDVPAVKEEGDVELQLCQALTFLVRNSRAPESSKQKCAFLSPKTGYLVKQSFEFSALSDDSSSPRVYSLYLNFPIPSFFVLQQRKAYCKAVES